MGSSEIYYPRLLGEKMVMDKTNLGDGFSVSSSKGTVQKALHIDMSAEDALHVEHQVEGSGQFTLIKDVSDMRKAVGVSAKASLKYDMFSGEAGGSFSAQESSSETSVKILYRQAVTLKTVAVDETASKHTKANPELVKENVSVSEVLDKCGGYYVSKIFYGALLEIEVTMKMESILDKQDIEAKAEGKIDLIAFSLKAAGDVSVEKGSQQSSKDIKINVRSAGDASVFTMPHTTVEEAMAIIKAFNPKPKDETLAVVGFQVRSLPINHFKNLNASDIQLQQYEANLSEAALVLSNVLTSKNRCRAVTERFRYMSVFDKARLFKNKMTKEARDNLAKLDKFGFISSYLDQQFAEIQAKTLLEFANKEQDTLRGLQKIMDSVDGLTGRGSLDLDQGLYEGLYEGYVLEDKPVHRGTLVSTKTDDGIDYLTGYFNEKGVFTNGTVKYTNGNEYKGDWKQGQDKEQGKEDITTLPGPHGRGKMVYGSDAKNDLDLATYKGDWTDGLPDGNGIGVHKMGGEWHGEWKNGKFKDPPTRVGAELGLFYIKTCHQDMFLSPVEEKDTEGIRRETLRLVKRMEARAWRQLAAGNDKVAFVSPAGMMLSASPTPVRDDHFWGIVTLALSNEGGAPADNQRWTQLAVPKHEDSGTEDKFVLVSVFGTMLVPRPPHYHSPVACLRRYKAKEILPVGSQGVTNLRDLLNWKMFRWEQLVLEME